MASDLIDRFKPVKSSRVLDLLDNTERLCRKTIRLEHDSNLDARGSVPPFEAEDPKVTIKYRDEDEYLDYVICHECGHIRILTKIPEQKLLSPAYDAKNLDCYFKLINKELHKDKYSAFELQIWQNGLDTLIGYLWNFPQDICIEACIDDNYPEFNTVQRQINEWQHLEYKELLNEMYSQMPLVIRIPRLSLLLTQSQMLAEIFSGKNDVHFEGPQNVKQMATAAIRICKANKIRLGSSHVVSTSREWAQLLGVSSCISWVPQGTWKSYWKETRGFMQKNYCQVRCSWIYSCTVS